MIIVTDKPVYSQAVGDRTRETVSDIRQRARSFGQRLKTEGVTGAAYEILLGAKQQQAGATQPVQTQQPAQSMTPPVTETDKTVRTAVIIGAATVGLILFGTLLNKMTK